MREGTVGCSKGGDGGGKLPFEELWRRQSNLIFTALVSYDRLEIICRRLSLALIRFLVHGGKKLKALK